MRNKLILTALATALCLAWPLAASAGGAPEPSAWFINQTRFRAGAHGSLQCKACHTPEMEGVLPGATIKHPNPADPAYLKRSALRSYDYRNCRQCHVLAHKRVLRGAHAEALARQKAKPPAPGAALAPVCGDCHNSHYDLSHLGRLASGRRLVKVCGSCHPAQAAAYMENFHGRQAVSLGNVKAAYCTDCHGAHTVKSLKKPAAALAACRRCHPKAGAKFALAVIHPVTSDLQKGDAALQWRVGLIKAVSLIMAVLALLTVAFFYGHNLLWLLRDLHHKIRRRDHD